MFTVLLDNGHGINTPGKCSPKKEDGTRFREYAYTRKVVKAMIPKLREKGYNVVEVTPEEWDVHLSTRVNRINKVCKEKGAGNCLFISVHNNAAGNQDKWMPARGWSAWTTKGQNNSDKLAEFLYDAAAEVLDNPTVKESFKGETRYKPMLMDKSDGDRDHEANFYVIKNTNCPSVLTENFFQDNKKDVQYLESDTGLANIVDLHIKGIDKFVAWKQKK